MKHYFEDKPDVVEFVNDQLEYLSSDCPWTMTITRELSGGYCVLSAIDLLSEDIEEQVARFFSETQVNT